VTGSTHRTRRRVAGFLAATVVLLGAGGCARQYRAEQDGKDAGEALCDVRGADSPEAAEAAIADFESALDELDEKYGAFTAEDRADISENLSDLQEHIANDNDALIQQDIAVIRRSLENIRDDLSGTSQAAVDGFLQGLDNC
jgi:hypothetical protein